MEGTVKVTSGGGELGGLGDTPFRGVTPERLCDWEIFHPLFLLLSFSGPRLRSLVVIIAV